MSDYTPTTERVRNSYANDIACFPKPENVFEANARAEAAKEEFDRWLASLKAEAMETGYNLGFVDGVKQSKAEAWDEGARWMRRSMRMTALDNPYRETEQ